GKMLAAAEHTCGFVRAQNFPSASYYNLSIIAVAPCADSVVGIRESQIEHRGKVHVDAEVAQQPGMMTMEAADEAARMCRRKSHCGRNGSYKLVQPFDSASFLIDAYEKRNRAPLLESR